MEDSNDASAPETDDDTFSFETDHVALKGNPDYHAMLKTILILEAQRTKAIHDLDTLIEKEKEALSDPIVFVNKLQRKEDLGLPAQQNIPELPDIEWEQYTSNLNPLTWKHKHVTRHKKASVDLQNALLKPSVKKPDTDGSSGEEDRPGTVRGRAYFRDSSKPRTFNKLWTADEQKQLEELLLKFPPEDVEMRRWEKIAKELGNRTPHQVQSRTQKYFIKLAKLGLPIPGRMPHVSATRRNRLHKHHRNNRFYFQPSTFLASYEPPVYMSDDESDNTPLQGFANVSDEEDIPLDLRHTEEYRQILRLKLLKRQRFKTQNEQSQHVGYKCDRCDCEPIVGTRWHCADCPGEHAVDFCDDCVDFEFENEHHRSSHKLDAVKPASESQQDTDYSQSSFMPGGYNYLDPNFLPPS